MSVRPKKHLGQHFLKDESVSRRIAEEVKGNEFDKVLEIGPGMGALTKYLLKDSQYETHVMEIDSESVSYLEKHYPQLGSRIHEMDFLRTDLRSIFKNELFAVVGNFPYNISTEILFKVLDYKDQIPLVVGMFQKEVAERVAEAPGSKKYGITSVLIQTFYDVEYLFTVDEDVFIPPPKVKSGVIKLKRNQLKNLPCDEKLFIRIVKTAFNQRRKTLRNSLKSIISGLNKEVNLSDELFSRRPETMSVEEFIGLTQQFQV